MKRTEGARVYRSDVRAAQAQATRRAVLLAARALFIEQGYGPTTLQQIAQRGGISVPTIYATFGTKRVVLEQVLDVSIVGDDEKVAVNDRDWMHDVFNHEDPSVRLASYAAAVRRILVGAADMFAVVQSAAAVDRGLQSLADEADKRRRNGATAVVNGLQSIGALRADIELREAVDMLWTLNSPELFQLLVRRSGWPPERYETWLAQALQANLLGDVKVRAKRTDTKKPRATTTRHM